MSACRIKPLFVSGEAMQWDGTEESAKEIRCWVNHVSEVPKLYEWQSRVIRSDVGYYLALISPFYKDVVVEREDWVLFIGEQVKVMANGKFQEEFKVTSKYTVKR